MEPFSGSGLAILAKPMLAGVGLLAILDQIPVPQALAGSIMFYAGIWAYSRVYNALKESNEIVKESHADKAENYKEMYKAVLRENERLRSQLYGETEE